MPNSTDAVETGLDVLGDRDQVQRQPPEHLEVLLRQAQQSGGDPGRELERHRLDQIDLAVVLELVDQLIADRVDHLGFPLRERALLERLAHQAAMVVMLLAVHAEDRRPEDQADRVVVHLRGEHRVLAEGREDAFEVEQRPVLRDFQLLGHQVALHERAAPHRRRLAHVLEESVRIGLHVRNGRLVVWIGADRHSASRTAASSGSVALSLLF